MALKQRERILAWATGSLVALASVQFGYNYVQALFDVRHAQITSLQREIEDKKAAELRGRKAAKKLEAWRGRSLPSDVVLARSLYKNWLARLAERTRLAKADVTLGADLPKAGAYVKIPVNVRGQGTIEQVVQFLFDFYQADHLHYIRSLTITPVATTEPPPAAAGEAISDGDKAKAEPSSAATAAATPGGFGERGSNPFSGRGGFGGGGFGGRGGFGGAGGFGGGGFGGFGRGGQLSQGPKYELILSIEALSLPGAENQDRLSDKKAERLAFKELDDYRKTIGERAFFTPYTPLREADPAADTFVTGLVTKDGKYQAWINVRSTGKTLKLMEGDSFELGKETATVSKIEPKRVEIEIGGRRREIALGKTLAGDRRRRGGRGGGPAGAMEMPVQ